MSKKSNKDHGEGLLSMQATRPHELEFVHILQKFKLCFNLLACLKAHIQDPNSPEMVHFLFTPLAMIVNASRETHPPGLAARVVAPLLSREAVDLLTNCLNSKETQLWHSLGDAWHLTREQWKGYVAPYQPVFMEGWSPTIPDRSSSSAIGVAVAEAATRRLQAQQETEKLESPFLRKLPHFHCTSVSISLSQIEPYTCSSSKSKYEIQLRLQLLQRCANIHSQTIPTMGDILMARDDDMMQQELRTVLTLFREKRKIEIQKNAEVYINQHSSVEEVQEWLKVKGFSDPISKQLSNMNGTELFSLKKEQLEAYCGKAEGRRLGSQINISRSTTGFKTARSSELRTILAKALAKVESGTSPSPNPSTRH
ncbi:epidermal growth factor receptor kinase substrate 8 isoform X2 [Folsomia candida]|nr:epidermal growth factor receptor kinase substrate 8 isoform X2 [Folsomia candida]